MVSAERAAAACAGENTATVLCDAANPATAGALSTSTAGAATVNINAGAGITGGASASAGATGDLTFKHNDPAGIGGAIFLDNSGTGGIFYTGAYNAGTIFPTIIGNGPISIRQTGGTLGGIVIQPFSTGPITINTVGSQLGSSLLIANFTGAAQNVDITTGAITPSPGNADILVALGSTATGNITVKTTAPVTNGVRLQTDGTGAISFTADSTVNGGSIVLGSASSPNTAAKTLTLNDHATVDSGLGISVNGKGVTTVTTKGVTGSLIASGTSGSVTVNGNVNNVAPPDPSSSTIFGVVASLGTVNTGTVAINGSVSVTNDQTASAPNLASATGVSASAGAGSIAVTGPVTVSALNDPAKSARVTGVDLLLRDGTITVDGAVSATVSGGFLRATGAAVSGGTGNVVSNLNGPVSMTATGTSTDTGTTALTAGVTSGTHVVNINDTVTATAHGIGTTGIGSTVLSSGTGTLKITANGAVTATADGTAMGVSVIRGSFSAGGTADVSVTTNETVTATSTGGAAIGVNYGFTFAVANARSFSYRAVGDVIATGLAGTFGIKTAQTGTGDVTIEVLAKVQSSGGAIDMTRTGAGNMFLTTGVNANVIGTTGVTTTGGTTAITHAGKITGTGGTAIQFGGTNDKLTLIPGYGITGNVIGNATSALQLGGTAATAFDLSNLGPGKQYNGFGNFNILAGSNWTLSGDSNFAGTVNVGQSLSFNNAMPNASFVIASGVTFGGNNTIGGLTVNGGGTLSPGNSIGAININGNLVLGAGAIYKIEVDGAASDKTTVAGSATLDGKVVVTPLNRLLAKTTYTIISAGSITGTFGSAELLMANNFAMNPVLSYAGGNVLLTLDPGLLSPTLPAFATANQKNVAGAIDNGLLAGRDLPAGFGNLFNLTPSGLTTALGQLSGEVHASTAGALVDESSYVRSAVLGRLRQASYGGDASMASLSMGGPQTAFADEAIESALAYGKSPIVTKAPVKAPAATSDLVFWAQGFGAWGRFNGDGNAATLRRDLAGFMTGFDMRLGVFGGSRVGFAAGYTGSQNNTDGRGSANVDTGHIATYGATSFGHWTLRTGGSYSFHTIDTTRTINFPGFFDRPLAHYNGGTGQAFGEAGYGMAFGNIAVEPFAGAAWVHLNTDATRERGGAAALDVRATTFETSYSTLGVRAASMVPLTANMILIPRASLAWQHTFGDLTPASTLAFVATGSPFLVSGTPIARDSLVGEAALDLAIGRNATLGISYNGQIARSVADHGAKGKFVWKF